MSVSSVSRPAPFISWVVPCARAVGAPFVSLRPSSRSFSGWVLVAFFPSFVAADSFATRAVSLVPASPFPGGVPFCAVRRCGSWWCVSVPVSVLLPVSVASCCPVFFASI
jgi:hypothetical protein